MNRIIFTKLLISLFLYVSLFGGLKKLWELVNGKPSKLIQIFDLPKIKIRFMSYELKIAEVMEKVFNFFFWFILWIQVYRIIKLTNYLDKPEYILTQSEALNIGITYLLLPTVFVVVLIIIIAAFREQLKIMAQLRSSRVKKSQD